MRKIFASLIVVLTIARSAQAQPAQSAPAVDTVRAATTAEATLVSAAWSALARGDVAAASSRVVELQQQFPRSTNSLWLDIEINLAHGGIAAALDGYDQWLNGRPVEEPLALRRIAKAALFDSALRSSNPAARAAALKALAADADPVAQNLLNAGAASGSLADAAALAAAGDLAGVTRVTAALAGPAPNKIALVEALATGKNPAAIPALVTMLNDPRPEHQAAAATALGQLGAKDQISKLRAMLTTPNAPPYVTMAVAGALLELGDLSGYDKLQAWMQSDISGIRAAAAKALSSRPDAGWTTTVQGLTRDTDPLVRLDAARLLAVRDPALARATLAQLAQDPDPTIREMAGQAFAATLPEDLTQLKGLLRQGDVTRAQAAQRILEATR